MVDKILRALGPLGIFLSVLMVLCFVVALQNMEATEIHVLLWTLPAVPLWLIIAVAVLIGLIVGIWFGWRRAKKRL